MSTPPLPAGYMADPEPALPSGYSLDQPSTPKQYLLGRDIGMRVAKGMGFDADALKAAEDRGGEGEAWSELGRQFVQGLKGMALDPLSPISQTASNFQEAIKSRDWAQIAGAASTILGGAESTRTGLEATSAGTRLGREAVGAAIHTPEGELTPGAETVGRVAGGAVGAGAGALVGHEYLGAAAGYKLGPTLMGQIFPEPNSIAEARQQAAAYQSKAQDLMTRGRQQEALDRAAAIRQARQQKLDALKAKQQAAQAPPSSPFPGATATNVTMASPDVGTLPPATTEAERMFQQNFGPEYAQARELARWETGSPEGVRTTPFQQQPGPQFVSKFAPPEQSKLVTPESAPPDVKVTYQSVPQNELLRRVKTGDKFAITEWQRRGLTLPPNVRYMIETGGTKPWRAYNE